MIKLYDILNELLDEKKLCPKGRAYYNRRIAAGEKPSAYLSGRAVKVCKGLMEDDIPQSGESSGTPAKFKLGTKPNKIESLTLDQILQQVKGIPYYKEVLDDLKNKDESWGVTKKVKEYAEYLMKNPLSSSKLPSVIVVDGKIQDGAHRISAIYLLQNLLDPKNNFWKNLKLKVEFWNSKNLNENIDPEEAQTNIDSVQTIVDGKRNIAFVVEKGDTPKNWERVTQMVADNELKSMYVKGNPHHAYVIYTPEAEKIAMELKTIAEKYNGYLSSNATAEDTRRIGQLLDYDPEQIELFIKDRYIDESLRDWFQKEDWVRIDTQGNITGPCGTMKKGQATTRCLPRAKANSLTKAERAATARKKVAGSKKGKVRLSEIDEYDVENEQDIKEFIEFIKEYQQQLNEADCNCLLEAEYRGRKVKLGKIMQGDIKKFKVYVKNDKGKVVKVNFGFGGKSAKGKRMVIKAKNPKRRAAYRARHNCDNPGPRWKANYWSCKKW